MRPRPEEIRRVPVAVPADKGDLLDTWRRGAVDPMARGAVGDEGRVFPGDFPVKDLAVIALLIFPELIRGDPIGLHKAGIGMAGSAGLRNARVVDSGEGIVFFPDPMGAVAACTCGH